MDTTNLHKHPKKMKSSKDKHEVFVLPPDLLKKLGISIGNINGSQEIPDDVDDSQSSAIINNENENIPALNCHQQSSDTSMLETASLMKGSVFLSPTFVSTIANAIPGEVEISSKNVTDDFVALTDLVEPQDIEIDPADSIGVTKLLCGSNNIREEDFKVDQFNITMNGEQTLQSNIYQEYPCQSLDGNTKQVVDSNVTFDEEFNELTNGLDDNHSFESGKNVDLNSTLTGNELTGVSFNDCTNAVSEPNPSEINIISEETIPLSKLKEIKRLQSLNGKNLKPVTVQSIIDNKTNIENEKYASQSTMEPNSTMPENTQIYLTDFNEVESVGTPNQNILKCMVSNEQIEATVVLSGESAEQVEEPRTDITSNVIEKDISENGMLFSSSTEKISIDFNDGKTKKRMEDGALNERNEISEDAGMLPNSVIVNGFDKKEEIETRERDKSVTICNGQMNGCTEPAVDHNENHSFVENNHICNKDNDEKKYTLPQATGIEEQSLVKENIKQISNKKRKSHSKNTLDSDSRGKKITENKISSQNVDGEEQNELSRILNASKNLSSNVRDIKVDKVKEIAAYLRKFSHIYTDKKKTKTALRNGIIKKATINSNTNTIESKLCIQGVEKPGGNEEDREHAGECKVLKTYARRNPRKVTKLYKHIVEETGDTVDNLDLDLDGVNITATSETQKFCLCTDFGRLGYYDCDDLYEHIHFWHSYTANCELDVIFAIYSDETVVSNSVIGLEQEEKTEENIEAYNVCWNLYQSELSENVDNSDTELIGQDYVIDELQDASCSDNPQVPVLNEAAPKVDDGISSKIQEVPIDNNLHSEVMLEIIDHDIVDRAEPENSNSITSIEKPLNTDVNDNDSAADSAEHISIGQCDSQSTLTSYKDSEPVENSYERRQSSSNENKTSRKEVQLDSPNAINKTVTKRRFSGTVTPGSEPSSKKSVKCALCKSIFSGAEWENHVANDHHLIAWRVGSSIDLDNPELVGKLKERLKTVGNLECSLCTMQIKKLNRFREHVKYCIRKKLSDVDKKVHKPARKSRTAVDDNVTCGVCHRTVPSSKWLEHIGGIHDYLAWVEGQEALNLDNETQVWEHMQNIIRLYGYLVCYKCGLQRSRVKTYQEHIKTCDGTKVCLDESSMSVDLNSSSVPEDIIKKESDEFVNCGVCGEEVSHSDWIDHISRNHKYLAWQEGETPLDLDDEEIVWNHLQNLIRHNGGLTCYKCGLVRKRVKLYLTHVEMCDGTNNHDNSSNNISLNQSTETWFEVPITEQGDKKVVKCGVCSEEVPILEWLLHIGKEHDYLAWQEGAQPLDLEDESAVKLHLLEISKQSGGLVCNKCEKKMKYPKTYQQHIKECTGPTVTPEKIDTYIPSWIETLVTKKIKDEILTCGVCADKIESAKWINHIEEKHEYLAWPDSQTPLNLEDPVAVQKHLNDISKVMGGLICTKCGAKRKYVKSFLFHVETCQGKEETRKIPIDLMNKDFVQCAVCSATLDPKHWREHAMKEHYNIAWVVGDTPIEINNPYAVESYLKEYHQSHNKLVCKVCKTSRVSYVGFYAHIIVCGKTEKETEIYKSLCELCNNKYLKIYKSQHMTMHREKEMALERRLLAAKEKALKKEADTQEVVIQTGRRKAAEKAKNVIEKYKNNFDDGNYNCSKCGFNSEIEKELTDHVCVVNKWGDFSDSDESVKLESESEDESDESEIDSNVSDEEEEAREEAICKKKKHSDSSSSKICRIPYPITNTNAYMKRSTEEFIMTYLTDDDLFPMWHTCEYEEVPENEIVNYLPPIEESCKVRFDENQDWMSFQRFGSSRVRDIIIMFLGASIQCLSWVPPATDTDRVAREAMLLCAVPHVAHDSPRLAWDTIHSGPGHIQIWDCGNLVATTPKFVLGIVHDFGTVWAIDWCPSGARDAFDLEPTPGNVHRLGLLAAACSNGLAYIFVVPYPSFISEKENPFYRLKPVVELRLTSNENRKVYQATAIKWSVQKGHSHVVVGYADGTTAYYDLNGKSPLLRTTENGRTVFYPFHDERVQNSCIEDVDMYPSGAATSARAGGAVCVGSAGGAGAGPLQSHVATARVLYPPHWPAALLAGDDCIVSQSINELEWWGGGRRLGGARGAAGCAWCGRLAGAAPPLLRVMRAHPAFPDLHKQVIGRLMMVPLGGKRKRQNDELAMIVEPITYSDAVNKYGVEFKHITTKDRTTQQKLSAMPRDVYPERFPLADVAAMQFCPTFKQHHKLAVALHSGLIFIINV